MTVKELIEILKTMPQDHTVYVNGYEGGLEDIVKGSIRITKVVRDAYTDSYMGDHEEDTEGLESVLISR